MSFAMIFSEENSRTEKSENVPKETKLRANATFTSKISFESLQQITVDLFAKVIRNKE
jgi:hypothetical protein